MKTITITLDETRKLTPRATLELIAQELTRAGNEILETHKLNALDRRTVAGVFSARWEGGEGPAIVVRPSDLFDPALDAQWRLLVSDLITDLDVEELQALAKKRIEERNDVSARTAQLAQGKLPWKV